MEKRVSKAPEWAGVEKRGAQGTERLTVPTHTPLWPHKGVCRFSTISLAGRGWGPGPLSPT